MGSGTIKSVVVVGGGTAGWLTAGLLAARLDATGARRFKVSVIEPQGIPPIGVGEGTWPSMRLTLSRIGVSERDFLKQTGASFKQGTKFKNWRTGQGDYYYHPFDAPVVDEKMSPVEAWKASGSKLSFARYVGIQEDMCEAHRSPKMLTSRDYAGVTNYGYHFEADGMAKFLKEHCQTNLQVNLIADHMTGLQTTEDGSVKAINTQDNGEVKGDFFVDCTGFHGLLIKKHFKASTIPLREVFSCDRALVARVPYHETAKIASTTVSTAQEAGWIWDVSLAKRFGVGYVHSSTHTNPEQAQNVLSKYLSEKGYNPDKISFRELKFTAGYVDKCWHKNCVAIGLSSGFIEPLEASSIMLTETAARELAEDLSVVDIDLQGLAESFNERFLSRWKQVVHFLKFHYVMSARDEPFWANHRDQKTIPKALGEDLLRWRKDRAVHSFNNKEFSKQTLFPLDSYKFVLHASGADKERAGVNLAAEQGSEKAERHLNLLPTNREWLRHLN